MEERK
jgi:hypothetical protein